MLQQLLLNIKSFDILKVQLELYKAQHWNRMSRLIYTLN